jgi:hypothetical protein
LQLADPAQRFLVEPRDFLRLTLVGHRRNVDRKDVAAKARRLPLQREQ